MGILIHTMLSNFDKMFIVIQVAMGEAMTATTVALTTLMTAAALMEEEISKEMEEVTMTTMVVIFLMMAVVLMEEEISEEMEEIDNRSLTCSTL